MEKFLSYSNGNPAFVSLPNQSIVTVTNNKIFVLTDNKSFQLCTNTVAINLTVSADSTTNFEIGSYIDISQDSTGSVTIIADTGVEIKRQGSTAISNHVLVGQYAIAHLKKVAANSWRLYGGLAW